MTDLTHPLSEAERTALYINFHAPERCEQIRVTPAEARAVLALRRAPSDHSPDAGNMVPTITTDGPRRKPVKMLVDTDWLRRQQDKPDLYSEPPTRSEPLTDGALPSWEGEWRCFHCDAVFTDRECAAEHFGKFEDCEPICTVGAERYRDLENQLASYRNDDDAATKEFYHLGAKHSQELVRSEERGYETGLRDARHEEIWRAYLARPTPTDQSAEIARLREALEPFATAYDGFERATTDARSTYGDALSAMRYAVRLPDFRRAATALASASGEKAAPS